MNAKILKAFHQDDGMACILEVQVTPPLGKMSNPMMLKLFDRRYAAVARTWRLGYGRDPANWATWVEQEYLEYRCKEKSLITMQILTQNEPPRWEHLSWEPAQREIYFEDIMRRHLETEADAWLRLNPLQCDMIPQFYGRISVTWDAMSDDGQSTATGLCHGLLHEEVSGFSLVKLREMVPQSSWQTYCNQVLKVLQEINELDVRTEGLSLLDFALHRIVNGDSDEEEDYDLKDNNDLVVVLINLKSCRIREYEQSEHEFRRLLALEDEEFSIGQQLELLTRGAWTYRRSDYYRKLDRDFPDIKLEQEAEIEEEEPELPIYYTTRGGTPVNR
ncbi:uncharacterized protein BO97DRAFT_458636 [Aspergillus homomorphus CBS 101889]|uniref:Uncharacterized protein n=1 Tax=Aspergillus homomorphus (strain CBS 101889) TaxID=1450537 RepID=A0A395I671_ASPHC|nr:hypothetical protein BO97DRAFT_458636 [Aspergillus homomorphus CBS 101889]RAL15752.1 hypothetical protein BO97DRAFT_458636 [Aspergillus homomorphus CBS 101889]